MSFRPSPPGEWHFSWTKENDVEGTYTKLRSGDWGIRVQGIPQPGQQVLVRRKDGKAKWERVDRVLWKGDGIALCSIAMPNVRPSYGPRFPSRRDDGATKVCWECGRRFTRADAIANDGDWAGGYCGC